MNTKQWTQNNTTNSLDAIDSAIRFWINCNFSFRKTVKWITDSDSGECNQIITYLTVMEMSVLDCYHDNAHCQLDLQLGQPLLTHMRFKDRKVEKGFYWFAQCLLLNVNHAACCWSQNHPSKSKCHRFCCRLLPILWILSRDKLTRTGNRPKLAVDSTHFWMQAFCSSFANLL